MIMTFINQKFPVAIMYIKTNYDHTYLIYELNLACVRYEESVAIVYVYVLEIENQ